MLTRTLKSQFVALLILASLANATAAQSPAPVRTAEVTKTRVQEHRRVTGSLQAVARSSIASQEPGQVETVLVDEGLTVDAGDVIAQLDARRLRAQLAEAQAGVLRTQSELAERKAELAFAEFEHRRIGNLHESQVASEREWVEAERLIGVARARRDAAERSVAEGEREVQLLSIRLDDMTVRAPYDARVVTRHVDPGEWIEPGEPIVTLVSTGTIEARLEVPERYAEPIVPYAARIYADVAGLGRTVASRGLRIISDVDPRARTFSVVLTLDNRDGALAPGMSVGAWVPTTDEAERLTVPKDAVVRSGREAFVYRSDTDESGRAIASKTAVTVLFDWQDRVAVAADELRAGDQVVVEGNERLIPGAPLALASVK